MTLDGKALYEYAQTHSLKKVKGKDVKGHKIFEPKSFWCKDKDPDFKGCNCFMHYIKFSKHISKEIYVPPTDYQMEVIEDWIKNPNQKIIINKGRQMAITELAIIMILYSMYSLKIGKTNIIYCGTNFFLAKKHLKRLYSRVPKEDIESENDRELIIKNKSSVFCASSDPHSIAGVTQVGIQLLDEASKLNLVDDTPALVEAESIYHTNNSTLLVFSTPNAKSNFFYDIINEKRIGWKFYEFDIWRTLDQLHTKEEIVRMIREHSNPDQDLLCKFTTSENSYFGTIDHLNVSSSLEELNIDC